MFHSYIADLKQKDSEWKGKLGRPNIKDMGLNIRALQNAGVMEHDIRRFASADDDPRAESRESLKNKNFARGKTDEEITRYKMLKHQLMMDTLPKTKGVITTCSKTADSKLKTAKNFVVAIIDEACKGLSRDFLDEDSSSGPRRWSEMMWSMISKLPYP